MRGSKGDQVMEMKRRRKTGQPTKAKQMSVFAAGDCWQKECKRFYNSTFFQTMKSRKEKLNHNFSCSSSSKLKQTFWWGNKNEAKILQPLHFVVVVVAVWDETAAAVWKMCGAKGHQRGVAKMVCHHQQITSGSLQHTRFRPLMVLSSDHSEVFDVVI